MADYGLGFRERYETDFVQIKNEMFADKRLSFKAKGILGYLLSKPNGWKVINKDLQNHAKDGRESIETGIQELRKTGYLVHHRTKKPDGTWGPTIWRYSDRPFFDPTETPEIIKVPFNDEELAKLPLKDHKRETRIVDETPDTTDSNHKRETRNTGNHVTVNPHTEKPYDITNKDLSNKELSNNKTTKTTKELKDLVISSSSPEVNKIDLIFKSLYKDAPLEEIKKKLFEDAENGKIKMKTEDQYLALFAKRIQFYENEQQNTPQTPETAQIDEITPEVGEISLEERSRQFKAFLSESEGVDNSELSSEPDSPHSEVDSEPNPEVANDPEPSSEALEIYLSPADRQKKITENLMITQDPKKTPEEIAEAKKEVQRLMDQIRDEKR